MKGQKKDRRWSSTGGERVNQNMIQTTYINTIRRKKEERRERGILILETMAVIGILLAALFFMRTDALAEDEGQCWVLCMPDGSVNLREGAGRKSAVFGSAPSGTEMRTDGKKRNGYLHVFGLMAEEESGWISERYVVYSEPEEIGGPAVIRAEGRVACREWIGGKISGWVYDGDIVTVYRMSDEWSATDRGYIKTEFLEVPKG